LEQGHGKVIVLRGDRYKRRPGPLFSAIIISNNTGFQSRRYRIFIQLPCVKVTAGGMGKSFLITIKDATQNDAIHSLISNTITVVFMLGKKG
jgi:hypothetical protein